MTILEALIQLRDDLKLWCINNFNHKLNKNLGTEESGKFLTVDSKGDIVTTSSVLSHSHSSATTSVAGFMSAADKTKLDGIATGATKITVDSSLSSTSTNPVQNKVINTALSNKANVPSLDTNGVLYFK